MPVNFDNQNPGSGICPECGTDGCGGWFPAISDEEMWLEAECDVCGCHWRDNYRPDDPDLAASEYCPSCEGHFTVVQDEQVVDGDVASVRCSCEECGSTWTETFSYAYSEELD